MINSIRAFFRLDFEFKVAAFKTKMSHLPGLVPIGPEKPPRPPGGKSNPPVKGKTDFGIPVNWPVGSDVWSPTTTDIRNVSGISEYKLYKQGPGFYDYRLEIQNTQTYNYHFYDETGDSYQINTYRRGIHYVRYDSDHPTVVFITGS